MVAAVLHLHESACVAAHAIEEMRRRLLDRHDVVDEDFLGIGDAEIPHLPEGLGSHLLVVADDARDLRHGGEHIGFNLRAAAGDDDRRVGFLAREAADRSDGPDGTASAVTAHVLTITIRVSPAASAWRCIASDLDDVEPAAERDDVDAHAHRFREQVGPKRALVFELDRPRHQHVAVAFAPHDGEVAAGQRDGDPAARQPLARCGNRRPRRRPTRRPA